MVDVAERQEQRRARLDDIRSRCEVIEKQLKGATQMTGATLAPLARVMRDLALEVRMVSDDAVTDAQAYASARFETEPKSDAKGK
jgi:hypothetical protein